MIRFFIYLRVALAKVSTYSLTILSLQQSFQALELTGKVLLLIRFFISLRVSFIQGFIIFSDNFVTSEKFLGSGTKWETSTARDFSFSCLIFSDNFVTSEKFLGSGMKSQNGQFLRNLLYDSTEYLM